MADYRVRPRARADLEDIWRYTVETWGQEQADAYLTEIFAGFDRLARNPKLGRDAGEIRAGYSRYPAGKHMIFYRQAKRGFVDIVRVLHERMLPERHL